MKLLLYFLQFHKFNIVLFFVFKVLSDNGINYIDTAYLYGNGSGSNERAVGEIIEKLGYEYLNNELLKENSNVIEFKYSHSDKMFFQNRNFDISSRKVKHT